MRQFIETVRIEKPLTAETLKNAMQPPYIFNIAESIATARVEKINEQIIKELYNAYLDIATETTTLIVIDMPAFKKFLMRALPKYLRKERRKNG